MPTVNGAATDIYRRRVTLLNDPYVNQTNGLPWTLGQDNRGYQYQIALDALPPGVLLNMIHQNQVWFIENSTTAFRLTHYAGTSIDGLTISGNEQGIVYSGMVSTTGYYGSFYDTTTQTLAASGVGYAMKLNTVDSANGFSIVSGSRIMASQYGTYNLEFSAQLEQTDNSSDLISIWLSKNGSDVAESNTYVNMPKQSAGNYSTNVAAWNWFVTLNSGDYAEIKWGSLDSTSVVLKASGSTYAPAVPSVIATIQQIASTISGVTVVVSGGGGTVTGSGITQLTGDVTAGPGYGSQAATLQSTTNVNSIISSNSTVTTNTANIAVLSGGVVSLSGSVATLSGNVATNTTNIADLSGSVSTISGTVNINTAGIALLSGAVTALSGSVSVLSGNLSTVSGVAYAALARSGGAITGNLTVASGFTVSGTSTYIGNATFSGTVSIASGLTLNSSTISGANGVQVNTSSVGSAADTIKLTDRVTSGSVSLRAAASGGGGGLELVNNAFSAAIFQVKDNGSLNITNSVTMNSNKITGLSTSPGTLTDAATVGMAGDTFPLTGLYNYIAWTNDPNTLSSTFVPVVGTVYYSALYIPYTTTVTGVTVSIGSAGAGLANSYVGLYNSTTQLGVSSAITTTWQSTGTKNQVLTATSAGSLTNLAPGIYWVALLVGNGSTTAPTFLRMGGVLASFTNVNLTATLGTLTVRAATGGTSQTALPGTIGLNAVASSAFWAGLT